MILRLTIGIILIGSLAGCSTTSKMPNTAHLQIRVAHMENQLDAQNQELTELRSTVDDLTLRIQRASSSAPPIKRIVQEKVSQPTPRLKSPQILRIPVPPQEVQKALKNAGYYKGTIDGKLGPESQKGIKEFQADHDLESDGIIGKKTWRELRNYSE